MESHFVFEPDADARELVRVVAQRDQEECPQGVILTRAQTMQLASVLEVSGSDQRSRVRRSLERALKELE